MRKVIDGNILLCGPPMSGKTTVGKLLAERLGWTFLDTDHLLGTKAGMSCREVFRQQGERYFRALEHSIILSLKESKHSVISLGGGAIATSEMQAHISALGYVIFLNAPSTTLWMRLVSRGIPAYLDPEKPEEAFHTLVLQREPIYKAVADLTLSVEGLTPEEIVRVVLQKRLQNAPKQ